MDQWPEHLLHKPRTPSSNPQCSCKCQAGVVVQPQSPHQQAETGNLSSKPTTQSSKLANSEFSGGPASACKVERNQ